MNEKINRCSWAQTKEAIEYHDHEWCQPCHDDRALFELLILEGMQAGLSWNTILKKREAFQLAFDNFEPAIVVGYGAEKIAALMANEKIIRSQNKLKSAISNAAAFCRIQEEFGSFDHYIWSFTKGKTIQNHLKKVDDMLAESPLSQEVSKDLKKRGFKYVGPVITYSYLQSIGIINDHVVDCDFFACAKS